MPLAVTPKHKYVHFDVTRTERKESTAAPRDPVLPYPKRCRRC